MANTVAERIANVARGAALTLVELVSIFTEMLRIVVTHLDDAVDDLQRGLGGKKGAGSGQESSK